MSALVDAKLEKDLRAHPQADSFFQAHVSLQGMHGAGAWLTATPTDEARRMDPVLFQLAVKRRLRMRVQARDSFCPMCGQTMDAYGDHALSCSCNGDRTTRHNCLRDCLYYDAKQANMSPEREKA
eukprot:10851651-Karenia_brevis.AAC.1